MVNLVAVQSELALEPYLSAGAFRAWVFAQCEEALAGLPEAPTLLAFPEAIGVPLLLTLGAPQPLLRAERLSAALMALARAEPWTFLGAFARRPWRGLAGALLPRAVAAHRAWAGAFAAAARAFGVTLVAGSSFLPTVEQEGLRGTYLADARVHNLALTFAPTGALLGASRKTKLTSGLESHLGLARGAAFELQPLATPLGRVGVAICLDAFFETVVSRFDGLGARVLVQPSANFAPWHGPWSGGRGLAEGEAWLRFGLRQMLQGRLNLAYGVNPMLVGELWGLRAEGRSSLLANARLHPADAAEQPGLLALAESHARFEVVRATVPWPERRREAVR